MPFIHELYLLFLLPLELTQGQPGEVLIQWSSEISSYVFSKHVKSVKKTSVERGSWVNHRIIFGSLSYYSSARPGLHMKLSKYIGSSEPEFLASTGEVSTEVLCFQVSVAESAGIFSCAAMLCVNQKVKQFLFQYCLYPISAVSTIWLSLRNPKGFLFLVNILGWKVSYSADTILFRWYWLKLHWKKVKYRVWHICSISTSS